MRRHGAIPTAFLAVLCAAALFHAGLPGTAAAMQPDGRQEDQRATTDSTDSRLIGYGAQVLLTNSGFGLGGFLSRGVTRNVTFVMDGGISPLRDEREVAFFDRFGQKEVPNKANYFIEIPVHFGFQRRIFRSRIEDNFRPFFHVSAGPTVGWKYPYFEDENANGLLERDERVFGVVSGIGRGSPEVGAGGSLTLGANFGDFAHTSYGVRIGYRFTYYRNPVELIDESIKPPERFIGSPVLMVHFGALRH